MDQATAEQGTHRLLAELTDYLAGPGRPLVPHGFEVKAVNSVTRPNVFAPDEAALATYETTVELQLPVIWEPEGVPARASERPAIDNVNELRELVEFALRTGEYWELHVGTLDSWEPTLPEGAPKPSNIWWSVTATICSN